jgi:4-hydroxy-2-oxoheptanedioate aldolase
LNDPDGAPTVSSPLAHARPNRFKVALRQGSRQIGLWSALCSNIVAEILAGSGFDWIVIDAEHGPNDVPSVLSQLQAMAAGTAEPVVRCGWNDFVLIKRMLDVGARTLLIPFVQNADEAKHAVAATRYPPRGIRGFAAAPRANQYGRVLNYHRDADESICVLVQVETPAALTEIENIAAVDGVDGIFIGPGDLSAALGHLGNPKHPDVQASIVDACRRIRATGKPAGILSPNSDEVSRYVDAGFCFVAVGSDVGILTKESERLAARWKQTKPQG